MSGDGVYELPRRRRGPILVVAVGAATGSRAAAAALACAGAEPDRAGLLVDLDAGQAPRPSLVATAGAHDLEKRLSAHLPEVGVASRGSTCHLSPVGVKADPDSERDERETAALDLLAAALPLVRDSIAVVYLSPQLLQPVLADPRIGPAAALLRADLPVNRALTALVARDLIDRGLRVAVLKRPLAWLPARSALFGVAPTRIAGLPPRLVERLFEPEDNKFPQCYDREGESEDEQEKATRYGPPGFARARWGRGGE